ncbi:hypothetical protein SAMN05421772_10361 [Paracoccus saliphilus]|uniref:Uncharacterized protein n=1 Tax=Paracoccus saliphilus TaxID=405559 RepID=A0AA46A4V6_9RHOB|nr:hypothetical protein SAMN05421772_10361 [Paracoccus saliphilus]
MKLGMFALDAYARLILITAITKLVSFVIRVGAQAGSRY